MDGRAGLAAVVSELRRVAYVTTEAPGALRNGTRIVKTVEEPGDAHAVGATGTVIGSLGPMPGTGEFGYFVLWDDMPGAPVFVRGGKVGLTSHES